MACGCVDAHVVLWRLSPPKGRRRGIPGVCAAVVLFVLFTF